MDLFVNSYSWVALALPYSHLLREVSLQRPSLSLCKEVKQKQIVFLLQDEHLPPTPPLPLLPSFATGVFQHWLVMLNRAAPNMQKRGACKANAFTPVHVLLANSSQSWADINDGV